MHWIAFVIGAALSWGAYGPSLHSGQMAFNDPDRQVKGLRALLCVGLAYFLVGVLVPAISLALKGQMSGFSMRGSLFSTLAGGLGALGAVCIIWALANGGKPVTVMPLVFAGAPIVNTLISIAIHPPEEGLKGIHPMLFVGLVLASAGAYLVLAFKPQ